MQGKVSVEGIFLICSSGIGGVVVCGEKWGGCGESRVLSCDNGVHGSVRIDCGCIPIEILSCVAGGIEKLVVLSCRHAGTDETVWIELFKGRVVGC